MAGLVTLRPPHSWGTRCGMRKVEGRHRGSPPSLASTQSPALSPSPPRTPVPCATPRKRQLAAVGLLGTRPRGLSTCERQGGGQPRVQCPCSPQHSPLEQSSPRQPCSHWHSLGATQRPWTHSWAQRAGAEREGVRSTSLLRSPTPGALALPEQHFCLEEVATEGRASSSGQSLTKVRIPGSPAPFCDIGKTEGVLGSGRDQTWLLGRQQAGGEWVRLGRSLSRMREGGERQSRLPWGVSGGVVGAGQESLGGNKSKTDSRRETGKRPQRTVPERHRQPRDWRLLKATERRGGETRGQPGQRWLAPAAWGGTNQRGQGGTRKGRLAPLALLPDSRTQVPLLS